MNAPEPIRLTSLSHGGGCGCKIAPAVLAEILAKAPLKGLPADLLVGTETGDDAAVWRLDADRALVATTDFFTPVVDDPYDWGRIAAANALSDVYAMGGRPILALALVAHRRERHARAAAATEERRETLRAAALAESEAQLRLALAAAAPALAQRDFR